MSSGTRAVWNWLALRDLGCARFLYKIVKVFTCKRAGNELKTGWKRAKRPLPRDLGSTTEILGSRLVFFSCRRVFTWSRHPGLGKIGTASPRSRLGEFSIQTRRSVYMQTSWKQAGNGPKGRSLEISVWQPRSRGPGWYFSHVNDLVYQEEILARWTWSVVR